MKTLISAAAVLAASTVFANAAVVTDVLTTTFSDAATSDVTSVTVTNDPSSVSASVTSLTDGTSDLEQMTTTSTGTNYAVAVDTYITPNTNVGSGNTWTLTLSYTIGSDALTINGVTLDTVIYSSSGVYQGTNTTRNFDLTLTIADNNGDTVATYTVSDTAITGAGNSGGTTAVDLSGSEVTLEANTTYTVSVTASAGDSNPGGCYIGLNGITYTIPEPSSFGLLAGVGALALVAARRRRSR